MTAAPPDLAADRIHVWRGDRHVLQGVSLTLSAGRLVHVRGPNGTGKTTLLRVISGLLRPERGTVTWGGRPIGEVRADYQQAFAYASHDPALKSDLTALENLRFAVGLKRRVDEAQLLQNLEATGVAGCRDLPARVLSAGQRRRVAMARVLAVQAPLWLLDEPFTNLDTAGSLVVAAMLERHTASGGMALVVAHHELELAGTVERLELAA